MNEKEIQTDDATLVPTEPVETTPTVSTETADAERASDTPTEAPAAAEGVTKEDPSSKENDETADADAKPETTTDASESAEVVKAVATHTVGFAKKAARWCKARKYTLATIVLVIIALVLFTYMLEKQGRIHTGLFEAPKSLFASRATVARVNDAKISRADLDVSISQITSGAVAQGVDTTDPTLQGQIQTQALDMLVNTELLLQKAAASNITSTDDDVTVRYDQLVTDLGGEEVLKTRMAEFGIDEKTLRRDIKNELTIQKLLKGEFETRGVTVTDEEVTQFYESAGGAEAGLPDIAEVSEQIKAQIKTTKEQEIVNALVEELRAEAAIEILI